MSQTESTSSGLRRSGLDLRGSAGCSCCGAHDVAEAPHGQPFPASSMAKFDFHVHLRGPQTASAEVMRRTGFVGALNISYSALSTPAAIAELEMELRQAAESNSDLF